VRRRPIAFSTERVRRSSARGDPFQRIAAVTFRKSGWSVKPTGSVR